MSYREELAGSLVRSSVNALEATLHGKQPEEDDRAYVARRRAEILALDDLTAGEEVVRLEAEAAERRARAIADGRYPVDQLIAS